MDFIYQFVILRLKDENLYDIFTHYSVGCECFKLKELVFAEHIIFCIICCNQNYIHFTFLNNAQESLYTSEKPSVFNFFYKHNIWLSVLQSMSMKREREREREI